MRCRCSCSALGALVALAALAGCGGGGRPNAFPDPRGPLDVHERLQDQSRKVRLETISFRTAGGKIVRGYVVATRRPGRRPAVLFLHGAGGTRADFLPSAIGFALDGGVGMTIQQPNNATSWAPLVENARRAFDVLQLRPDVDPSRLGLAGLSLGAETAAIVAGVDPRPRVVGLMSCRGRQIVLHYLRYARASFYVQNGSHDEVIPRWQLRLTIAAIPGHPRINWYRTGHVLNDAAFLGQIDWLRAELHPGRAAAGR